MDRLMNKFITTLILLTFAFSSTKGQIHMLNDSVYPQKNNDDLYIIPKRPWRAAAITFGTNMSVWAFDRFISNSDYSRISLASIKSNLHTGFVWDEDMFSTNLFAHPYHGGLYFNAARSNGMNFWQSIPYSASGSLMWEFCMENEHAAVNDFFATTTGGSCLGEMTFRISDLLIDNRAVGFERFGRECLITLISPIRGLNRLLNGESRRYSPHKNYSLPKPPVIFYATTGYRAIADNLHTKNDVISTLNYDMGLYYGNPYDEENDRPYDFFTLRVSGNFTANQPIVHRVNALGMLYINPFTLKNKKHQLAWGIFQHFNFYEMDKEKNHDLLYPYKISEAASAGPGILHKYTFNKKLQLSGAFYLSGILLGGSQTDHFVVEKRDYNMGSGFSTKLNLQLQFARQARIYLNTEDYRIYSWIGSHEAIVYAFNSNTQGDVGHASLSVARLGFQQSFFKHLLLTAEVSYIYRRSYYKYYTPAIEQHNVQEAIIQLGYLF